jgi:hypothetical protein
VVLGRKGGSYKFEKRQKEIKKQKKRRDKLERRQTKPEDDEEPIASVPVDFLNQASEQ